MKQRRAALLLGLATLASHAAVGCAFVLPRGQDALDATKAGGQLRRRPGPLYQRHHLEQQRVPVYPSQGSTTLRVAGEMGPEDKGGIVRRRGSAIPRGELKEVERAQEALQPVPERVAGPLVEELSRTRINRPALSRSVACLGDWAKGVMAEKDKEKAEKEKVQERARTKQTELLQLRGMLSMRGALEAFQQEVVRPALGLGPKVPITPERWNKFLADRPTLLARIERQTPWWGERIWVELSDVFTILSGHVHSFQIGASGVTILEGPLSPEHCLLLASILYDDVNVELDPPGLQKRFDEVEALAGSGER